MIRRLFALAALAALAALLAPAGAPARTVTFSGSCQFAGPISPMPPITLLPQQGAHFSYLGKGTCSGSQSGPITVTFTDVSTVFDTCELGPDFNLTGVALIGSGAGRERFVVTINLARLALAGPFTLSTTGGGSASGLAQFEPQNATGAPEQCASGGVSAATLSASFRTSSPLVGTADPAGTGGSATRPAVSRWRTGGAGHHRHHHHRRGRHGCRREGSRCSGQDR